MIFMDKDEFLLKRIRELANLSYQRDIVTFSDFLNLNEQNIVNEQKNQMPGVITECSGGYEQAERQMVAFHPDALAFTWEYPITCLKVEPKARKFSEDLGHRDYLGALMNLGIERSTIGDILPGEGEAFLFCLDTIAEFICDNLEQIRHTHVKCEVVDAAAEVPREEPVRQVIQVASPRVDAVISKVYNKSRSDCLELFRVGKVYVNGRLCENNSKPLEAGDVVNARGYGKFRISGEPHATRKGKLAIEAEVYP